MYIKLKSLTSHHPYTCSFLRLLFVSRCTCSHRWIKVKAVMSFWAFIFLSKCYIQFLSSPVSILSKYNQNLTTDSSFHGCYSGPNPPLPPNLCLCYCGASSWSCFCSCFSNDSFLLCSQNINDAILLCWESSPGSLSQSDVYVSRTPVACTRIGTSGPWPAAPLSLPPTEVRPAWPAPSPHCRQLRWRCGTERSLLRPGSLPVSSSSCPAFFSS